MLAILPVGGVSLGADVLSRSLDQRAEHLAEVLCGRSIRVQPLGREQLPPRALVLLAGLEERHQPPVNVVVAHDVRIGRCKRICDPDRSCMGPWSGCSAGLRPGMALAAFPSVSRIDN